VLSFIAGLIVAFILIYLTCIFENASFAMLGMAAALFMVLSFLSIKLRSRELTVKLDIPLFIVEKDKPFHLKLTVNGNRKVSAGRIGIILNYRNVLSEKKEKKRININITDKNNSETMHKLCIGKSGYYCFEISSYRVYDRFGIFYLEYKLKENSGVLVLPNIRDFPVTIGDGIKNFYGDSDSYYTNQPGSDPSETYDVRDFRNGDRLSKIHWKMSVKKDELIVREDSMPKVCAVIVLLGLTNRDPSNLFDNAASLSFSLMCAECVHYVSWISKQSGEPVRVRVEDEESFYGFLIEFMQDCTVTESRDLTEIYSDKYKGEQWLYAFTLEDDKIMLNEDEITIEGDAEIILN